MWSKLELSRHHTRGIGNPSERVLEVLTGANRFSLKLWIEGMNVPMQSALPLTVVSVHVYIVPMNTCISQVILCVVQCG